MPKNMELFNEATAIILNTLYTEFPNRLPILRAEDIKNNASEEELKVIGFTAEFLLEEGFIVGGNSHDDGQLISRVRLTSKGLAVLKISPETLSTEKSVSFGDALKNVLGTGSTQALNTIITELMSSYVRFQIQT